MSESVSFRKKFSIKNALNVIPQIEHIQGFLRSSTCKMLLKNCDNNVCQPGQKTSILKYEGRKKEQQVLSQPIWKDLSL